METLDLLKSIRTILENEKAAQMPTALLVEKLPVKITARKLAGQLKPYGITSKLIRIDGSVRKGYCLEQFDEAIASITTPDAQNQPASDDPPRVDAKPSLSENGSVQNGTEANPVIQTGKDVWLVARSSGIKILRAVLTGLVRLGEQSAQWKEKLND